MTYCIHITHASRGIEIIHVHMQKDAESALKIVLKEKETDPIIKVEVYEDFKLILHGTPILKWENDTTVFLREENRDLI